MDKEDWSAAVHGVTKSQTCMTNSTTIVVLQSTLKGSLDLNETKPVNSKENQLQIFTGRTDAEAPILWPPDAKSQLIGKDPDSGKD